MAIPVAVLLGQAARLGIGAVARKWGRKKLIREIAKKTAKQKDLSSKTRSGTSGRHLKTKKGK